MPKSLKHPRTIACLRQLGRCYYCTLPMWSHSLPEFASKYGLTVGQAKELQCTGEHLAARQDGGDASNSNIVAACEFCNQHRDRRKNPLPPEPYKKRVNARMSQGRWHYPWLRTETPILGISLAGHVKLHANHPRAGDFKA